MVDRKETKRPPINELRARAELAQRALADVATLMEDADPIGAPDDFAERERKAIALLEQDGSLLPQGEPLSDEERERLEEELADAPDEETMREIFRIAKTVMDDPSVPQDVKDELSRVGIGAAMATLDELDVLEPLARSADALAQKLSAPPTKKDPRVQALRHEAERRAAKLRS